MEEVTILRGSEEYNETLDDIERSLGIVPGFMRAVPADVLVAEWPLFKKYVLGESKVPAKYRELIGLVIAANIKCPYCQLFHKSAAKLRGATDEELAEATFLASFSSRWSAMIHAQHYDYDTFEKEVHQIGEHLKKAMSGK
ncbi:MAG: carboxymuconolactone decarboxylase family protein [Candidatus Bathyarchaeota archaeon]|nr:carboxymuconolactone decarboxylase family protein [Candidatus Bathyarchaeota archaeon]